MACNCKKNYDEMEKYADDHVDGIDNEGKTNIFLKILEFLYRIPLGILAAALIIIMMVPFLIYTIICVIFGLEPHINIKLPRKFRKNKWKKTVPTEYEPN